MAFNFNQPPANLDQRLVVDTPATTGCAIAARVLTIASATGVPGTGSGSITEKIDSITSVTKTAPSAGQAQMSRPEFTAIAPVAGQIYTIGIRRFDTDQVVYFRITAADTNAGHFANAVAAALVNFATEGGFVTGTVINTTQVTIQQVLDTGGFALVTLPTGTTIAATTTYIASSGTLAEVQQYNATAAIATYDKYTINKTVFNPAIGRSVSLVDIVWVGAGQTNTAAWEDLLDDILDGSGIAAAADAIPYVAVQ